MGRSEVTLKRRGSTPKRVDQAARAVRGPGRRGARRRAARLRRQRRTSAFAERSGGAGVAALRWQDFVTPSAQSRLGCRDRRPRARRAGGCKLLEPAPELGGGHTRREASIKVAKIGGAVAAAPSSFPSRCRHGRGHGDAGVLHERRPEPRCGVECMARHCCCCCQGSSVSRRLYVRATPSAVCPRTGASQAFGPDAHCRIPLPVRSGKPDLIRRGGRARARSRPLEQ